MVEVAGEVDLATAPELREALHKEIEGGAEHLLVDLRSVEFFDSSGLGVLVGALKRIRERQGKLALVCGEGPVLKVLTITGLDRVFAIHAEPSAVLS